MHPLIQRLIERAPVILDGAWGTRLQATGLPPGACPDEWNLSHPAGVEAVARAYVDAGSDIILTNTFRANRIALQSYGLADRVAEINRRGVEISKRAANNRALVFASIGPSGKMLMMEEVTEDELAHAFTEQAASLAEAGCDGLVIETMTDLVEASIALRAAKSTGLPVAVSMVFDSGKQRDRTMMGKTPEDVAAVLSGEGADIIGANCGVGIEQVIPVASRLRAATSLPIWIKPNAGMPEMINGSVCYHTTPEMFLQSAMNLKAEGVAFVGGCCGTTPEIIAALRKCFRGA